MLEGKLLCHFLGNGIMWLYYAGGKSIDEVSKRDNSGLGFIVLIIIGLLLFAFV